MQRINTDAGMNHAAVMTRFDAMHTASSYRALNDPGLVIGTGSAAMVKITNTTTFLHNGIFKSKATAEVAFTATTHDIAPSASAIQEAKYLVCLIADGTPSLVMGAIAGAGLSLLPDVPAGKTPIGYVLVQVAAGATPFDASTDLLSAAHITDTFVSMGFIAPRFDTTQ